MTLSTLSLPTSSPLLSNALTRQHVHTPAIPCTSMLTCQHANAPMCQPTHQRTDTPTRQHAKLQTMRLRTSDAPSDAPAHQCITCRSVDMLTCQHANVRQCVHAQSPTRVPMHVPAPGHAGAIESHTPGIPCIVQVVYKTFII